jgi:hypothetical protein
MLQSDYIFPSRSVLIVISNAMSTSTEAQYNFFTFISQQIRGSIVIEAYLLGNSNTDNHFGHDYSYWACHVAQNTARESQ